MRLNKAIARVGVASRRAADELIASGRVLVDGSPAGLGCVLRAGSTVTLDGKPVNLARVNKTPKVWMHHKAAGALVSTRDDLGRFCLMSELQKHLGREHLIPVGRLDYNTEGLLLLTDSGDLARRMAHPSFGVERHYRIRVRGKVDQAALDELKSGITVRGVKYGSIRASIWGTQTGSNAWVDVWLREGKNREIRHVFEDGLRLQISRLLRLGFGPYRLPRSLAKGDTIEVPLLFKIFD